jgi:hypothetical protein
MVHKRERRLPAATTPATESARKLQPKLSAALAPKGGGVRRESEFAERSSFGQARGASFGEVSRVESQEGNLKSENVRRKSERL